MSFTDGAHGVLAVALTGVLAWAAISDIRTRRIPNAAVLATMALFLPWIATDLGASALTGLQAAGLVFAASLALYAFKVFGAGDCKLLSAAALFTGMDYLPQFAILTALAGGVLALISLASRPQAALVAIYTRGRISSGVGVPYGVAIALGGVAAVWSKLLHLPAFGVSQPFVVTGQALGHALAIH